MAQSKPALLPRHAPDRLAALDALEAAIAADTLATLAELVGDGWPAEVALDHYRYWLHSIVDAACDEGCCEWLLEVS